MEVCENKDWAKTDTKYIWHPCSQMKDYEDLPPIVSTMAKGFIFTI